jgi:DNA polymerase III subunit delta
MSSLKQRCYFIYGPDSYRATKACEAIEQRFLAQDDGMANLVKYDMAETSLDTLKQSLLAMPFLVSHRLFILKYPFAAPKSIQEGLVNLLPTLGDSTIVVVLEPGAPDKRLALYKWLCTQVKVQEFPAPTPADRAVWLDKRAHAEGITLEPTAKTWLVEQFPSDTWGLVQEMEKLKAYVLSQGRTELTRRDLEEMGQNKESESIWNLTDALRDGNIKQALRVTQTLLRQDDPFMITGLLASQIRTLAKVMLCREVGIVHQAEVARIAKLNPYVVKLAVGQAARLKPKALKQSYASFVAFDSGVKEGRVEPRLGLSLLLIRLCAVMRY